MTTKSSSTTKADHKYDEDSVISSLTQTYLPVSTQQNSFVPDVNKSETVWGVVGANHGASLCVYDIKHKCILFASKSERFSETKNDPDLSLQMQEWAVKEFGLPRRILFHERKWLKQLRRIYAKQNLPFKSNKASLHPLVKNVPTTTYGHHLSHVANGFHTSEFPNAIVICVDAVGEFDTVSVWYCDHQTKRLLHRTLYPNSVGLFYGAMVQAAGLIPGQDEAALMAASAPNYGGRVLTKVDFEHIPEVIRTPTWPLFKTTWNWHHSAPDYLRNQFLTINDYAATAQSLLTRYVREIVNTAKVKYGGLTNNLVLTGGVFQNVVLNATIAKTSHFGRIHIPLDPSDSGSAIGAAMLWARVNHKISPFLGFSQPKVKAASVILELMTRGIAGVINGNAEFGDRALGNRSILALPSMEMKQQISNFKGRSVTVPLPCLIREEDLDRFFHRIVGVDTSLMQYILRSKEKERDQLRPILHIDNTAVVQTVRSDSYLYAVLTALEADGKYPVLINTSFNLKGQPMVNSKKQAMHLGNYMPILDSNLDDDSPPSGTNHD